MALCEWNSRYEVGVKEIDSQHRKLFELINRLDDEAVKKKDEKALSVVLLELVRYTQYHFGAEEQYMRQLRYPHFTEHMEAHNRFVKDIAKYIDETRTDKFTVATKLLGFLSNWLINHIGTMDKRHGLFLKQHMDDI